MAILSDLFSFAYVSDWHTQFDELVEWIHLVTAKTCRVGAQTYDRSYILPIPVRRQERSVYGCTGKRRNTGMR